MSGPERFARAGADFLAYRRTAGGGPTLLWLGGFGSDMEGAKASFLAEHARSENRASLRFDYFGHGSSSGAFRDGSIGLWIEDALAIADALTTGPLILVGSSMGAWIAAHLALARPERVAGLVLIAPAIDFTARLLRPGLSEAAREALRLRGSFTPEGGFEITRRLLEEAERWLLLPGPIAITAPVRVLQGGADTAVPARHALETAEAFSGHDLVLTLIKDGDHRLSRPQDLERLRAALADLGA